MNMRKQTWKAAVSAAAVAATAAIPMAANASSITIDSVQQRWPWNNKVDITYTVSGGQDVSAGVYAKIVFTATVNGTEYTIDGTSDVGASASDGQHTVTWTPPSGLKVKTTDCTMVATLSASDAPSGDDYMIIDLDDNYKISYEGLLASQEASNARYNTDTYKTSKMVLRKVPRWANKDSLPNAASLTDGGYPTGDDTNYATTNSRKYWPTQYDYYIGVFMVTAAQYYKVTGANSSTSTIPRNRITWNSWRDSTDSDKPLAPSSSGGFLAKLNYKIGKTGFDMPTEVMSEIAQRAGVKTDYTWGDTWDVAKCINKVGTGNHGGSSLRSDAYVGLCDPNNWGLYDTTGLLNEFCLDTYDETSNLSNNEDAFIPACNGDTTTARSHGGGSYYTSSSATFRASARSSFGKSLSNNNTQMYGVRVAYIVK